MGCAALRGCVRGSPRRRARPRVGVLGSGQRRGAAPPGCILRSDDVVLPDHHGRPRDDGSRRIATGRRGPPPHLAIPSQPRRGRHLIEVARGYHLANDLKAALGTLDSAYKTAPETIRYNGYARKILFELATEGPVDLRRDANGLADRIGMLV